jgi:hypothetical protein
MTTDIISSNDLSAETILASLHWCFKFYSSHPGVPCGSLLGPLLPLLSADVIPVALAAHDLSGALQ